MCIGYYHINVSAYFHWTIKLWTSSALCFNSWCFLTIEAVIIAGLRVKTLVALLIFNTWKLNYHKLYKRIYIMIWNSHRNELLVICTLPQYYNTYTIGRLFWGLQILWMGYIKKKVWGNNFHQSTFLFSLQSMSW